MEFPFSDLSPEHKAIPFALKILEEFCSKINKNNNVHDEDISTKIYFLKL